MKAFLAFHAKPKLCWDIIVYRPAPPRRSNNGRLSDEDYGLLGYSWTQVGRRNNILYSGLLNVFIIETVCLQKNPEMVWIHFAIFTPLLVNNFKKLSLVYYLVLVLLFKAEMLQKSRTSEDIKKNSIQIGTNFIHILLNPQKSSDILQSRSRFTVSTAQVSN